jgi:formylglycine-generating enzyme required for sulfatase activity
MIRILISVVICLGFLSMPRLQAAAVEDASRPDPEAIRLAIEDLQQRFGAAYPKADAWLQQLDRLAKQSDEAGLRALRREALLANPLLDFERLLLIRRNAEGGSPGRLHRHAPVLGLVHGWQANSSLGRGGWDNEIMFLEDYKTKPRLEMLYDAPLPELITDLELHFDGERLLFSMIDDSDFWQIHEIGIDGDGYRRVTPLEMQANSYDACYLPDERIIFASDATGQGVPCTKGSDPVANLHRMNPDGTGIRRLCFDQDQNWMPTVNHDGSIMFARWQYSDQAHFFARTLLRMNPDGTNQRDLYGTNSYWPTSLFYSRPIPGNQHQFIGIVSGHHGAPRMGEMILFDLRKGTRETDGVVQRITDRGETVRAKVADKLVDDSWPKFLHPYPLSAEYFLAAAQPTPDSLWGIYLVDVFDNMVLLHEEPGTVLFEPLPLQARTRPPLIPDRVNLDSSEARLYIADLYQGPGLKGVPRDVVKGLRLYTFNFPATDGHKSHSLYCAAIGGAWDLHAVLGTAPVEKDGSAFVTVPVNTPIAIQPLDADGQAVQVMRTWLTAMPGETLSCAGCHESVVEAPVTKPGLAMSRPPSALKPFYGPTRGFDFRREIQPILQRRCIACHDGTVAERPDLRDLPAEGKKERLFDPSWFSRSYTALQRYVRRPGPESLMEVLPAGDHHADQSELVQMLRKGHQGVELNAEEWDRIITWIDINVPFYGTWGENPTTTKAGHEALAKRKQWLKQYGNVDWTLEEIHDPGPMPEYQAPDQKQEWPPRPPEVSGWPLDAASASAKQRELEPARKTLQVPGGDSIELVRIPAGRFVMGSAFETPDELPQHVVRIDQPFWMATTEITNEIFRAFAPEHDSGSFNMMAMSQWGRKHWDSMDQGDQPAARVSWRQAQAFCDWLSEQTGASVVLPTEAQWEWAARAGSDLAFSHYKEDADISGIANVADKSFGEFHDRTTSTTRVFDERWNDKSVSTMKVGRNDANPWGLHDMHGNIAEWTRSLYKPYPYVADDGRNDVGAEGRRVLRGGSFADRPHRCTSSFRLGHQTWIPIYNAGIRIVIADDGSLAAR